VFRWVSRSEAGALIAFRRVRRCSAVVEDPLVFLRSRFSVVVPSDVFRTDGFGTGGGFGFVVVVGAGMGPLGEGDGDNEGDGEGESGELQKLSGTVVFVAPEEDTAFNDSRGGATVDVVSAALLR